eukprot:Hpha_TRINITY_DN11436_c0_g1::TRINITY_DN11436_c0_g1_i1::g.137398::m.137398
MQSRVVRSPNSSSQQSATRRTPLSSTSARGTSARGTQQHVGPTSSAARRTQQQGPTSAPRTQQHGPTSAPGVGPTSAPGVGPTSAPGTQQHVGPTSAPRTQQHVGPRERRDLRAVALQEGQHEGRSSFDLRPRGKEGVLLEEADKIVRSVVSVQRDIGGFPNCYYGPRQGIWRGKGGFIYYPPVDAYKVCLNRRHPDHEHFRNMYHGTTIDRLDSILRRGLMLSGTGEAVAQNPYGRRHMGRIFSTPQWDTALAYAKPCHHEGRAFRVVLKILQDPRRMSPLEDPQADGEEYDGDYFYTTDPDSLVVFAILIYFE